MAKPIFGQTLTGPLMMVAATGKGLVSVIDLAALLPQLDTAITERVSVVGTTGYLMEMLDESVLFTLNKTAPVGNVHL